MTDTQQQQQLDGVTAFLTVMTLDGNVVVIGEVPALNLLRTASVADVAMMSGFVFNEMSKQQPVTETPAQRLQKRLLERQSESSGERTVPGEQ